MTQDIRIRAYKCLLEQANYVTPADPCISFKKAYIVKDEIYLTEDAAERATHEYRPVANIEIVTYREAYETVYNINVLH